MAKLAIAIFLYCKMLSTVMDLTSELEFTYTINITNLYR